MLWKTRSPPPDFSSSPLSDSESSSSIDSHMDRPQASTPSTMSTAPKASVMEQKAEGVMVTVEVEVYEDINEKKMDGPDND